MISHRSIAHTCDANCIPFAEKVLFPIAINSFLWNIVPILGNHLLFYGTNLIKNQLFYETNATLISTLNLNSFLWHYTTHILGILFLIFYFISCIIVLIVLWFSFREYLLLNGMAWWWLWKGLFISRRDRWVSEFFLRGKKR